MKFGSDHYVPILKAKQAEADALTLLKQHLYAKITPLIEIVERKEETKLVDGKKIKFKPSLDQHFDKAFKYLRKSIHKFNRCFLDLRELENEGAAAAEAFFSRAKSENIKFTPVTGISRSVDVTAALNSSDLGLCLRLTVSDMESGNLKEKLASFLKEHSLTPQKVDLIIDLGPDRIAPGLIDLSNAFLAEIPNHSEWHTFTISACAFPKTLGTDKHVAKFKDRDEWIAWYENLFENKSKLERLPTFSDCGIQHPTGVEGIDFSVIHPPPSIRYTLEKTWLLLKGEGGLRQPRHSIQFPGLAVRLTQGDLASNFLTESHCEGCSSAKKCGDGLPKHGSNLVWRRIGTIHHLTIVREKLDSLPWT